MSIEEAREITERLIKENGLKRVKITFSNKMTKSAGKVIQRVYSKTDIIISQEIKLSIPFLKVREKENSKNTIIHEVAHLLTIRHGHDNVWRKKCIELGGDGKRMFETTIDEDRRFEKLGY